MPDAVFHLVCHDCTFEALVEDRDRTHAGAISHRNRTGHDVEYDLIDGHTECEDCGRSRPVGEIKTLINVLSSERSFICEDCHQAGAIW